MTRTDVMASSRPRTSVATIKRLTALVPLVLLMTFALLGPASAIAAEGTSTSGYNQEPPKPEETGTSPSKETSEPAKEEPAAASEPKATTLPFTGFDLRWSFAIGLLLIGGGMSIVVVQRRQRKHE